MFSAQIVIRADVGELKLADHGTKLTHLYTAAASTCLLILAWFSAAIILITLTMIMACCALTPCINGNKEKITEIKETYIRIGFLPFGVCRKNLLSNEITQWWIMFLFAVCELAMGTVFIMGFVSLYFSACYYTYLFLGW